MNAMDMFKTFFYMTFLMMTLNEVVSSVEQMSNVTKGCATNVKPLFFLTNNSNNSVQQENGQSTNSVTFLAQGRTRKSRRCNSAFKRSFKRKNIRRRKIHRHSKRVYTLKPAVILLPPLFESEIVDGNNPNALNPFVINFLINDSVVPMTPSISSTVPEKIEPTNEAVFNNIEPSRFLLPPLHYDSEYINHNQSELLNSFEEIISTTEFYNSYSFHLTTEEYHKNIFSAQEHTTSELPIEEGFPNDASTFLSYGNYNFSTNNPFGEIIYDTVNNSEMVYPSSFNNYNVTWKNNMQNTLNSTLLAPEIALLGMKVVTSEKGIEMFRQYSNLTSDDYYNHKESLNSGQGILETAETGDFLRNTFSQQSINELPKEVYQKMKKRLNPYKVCKKNQGLVADVSSGCQIFYICLGSGGGEPMMCPNGTLFNQDFLVCDWWYNVECTS